MFKTFKLLMILGIASVNAGLLETHHVVHEPVLTKVGSVVQSVPSAVSHQSFTRIHNRAEVSHIVAPAVRTTVLTSPSIVNSVETVPVVKTIEHVVPAVKTVDIEQPLATLPVVHTAPFIKSLIPVTTYALHH
uniref:Uncharacterized protein n=1 Tax=Glossina palpalis gambiensis TaxID=67801 RepID=A0A1B0BY43_9MUSC